MKMYRSNSADTNYMFGVSLLSMNNQEEYFVALDIPHLEANIGYYLIAIV